MGSHEIVSRLGRERAGIGIDRLADILAVLWSCRPVGRLGRYHAQRVAMAFPDFPDGRGIVVGSHVIVCARGRHLSAMRRLADAL